MSAAAVSKVVLGSPATASAPQRTPIQFAVLWNTSTKRSVLPSAAPL